MGCGPSSENAMGSFEVNQSTLSSFLQIEKEIADFEAKNPIKPLDLKADQLVQLQEKIEKLKQNLNELNEKTETTTEKFSSNRRNSTKKFFMENGVDEKLSKDQLKVLDSLNEKEILTKELETAEKQYKEVTLEVKKLEKDALHLDELYEKQDKLLGKIFNGEYGSLKEKQLENELDLLEGQRGRILEANFKWRQAQMMMEYAVKQMGVAVKKWKELPGIPVSDVENRYGAAAEVRNNLVAAGQNISGAKRYLHNVDLPYCNPDEIATLNKESAITECPGGAQCTISSNYVTQAAQYVFTDMQIPERYEHAKLCYITIYRRSNALMQWFDSVINTTIMSDLHETNERVKAKALELRKERVNLIRIKVKETYGTDVQLDQTLRSNELSTDEIAKFRLNDNQVVKLGNTNESSKLELSQVLEMDELAPIPSNTVIFGNSYNLQKEQIESLAKKHQGDLENFKKEQTLKQEKMKGELEEKLMMRRQRRARIKMEETQRSILSNDVKT